MVSDEAGGGYDRGMPIKPGLVGVPETALWTLWLRGLAASGPDPVLHDPLAVELAHQFDYPFEERLGKRYRLLSQLQAMRVLTFDREVRGHASVVALGEGLETQFWRLDDGRLRWLTVDLPEVVRLRQKFLPYNERLRTFAGSALDPAWMDEVDPAEDVLISAQGLLMYLQPQEVHDLLTRCARRFPGATMVFDALPPWTARVASRGTIGFQPPRLSWTLDPGRLQELERLDGVAEVSDVKAARSRGLLGRLVPALPYLPFLGRRRPLIIVRLDFV
jgi:O-methyltransferase involved in polyketide biosynthesis